MLYTPTYVYILYMHAWVCLLAAMCVGACMCLCAACIHDTPCCIVCTHSIQARVSNVRWTTSGCRPITYAWGRGRLCQALHPAAKHDVMVCLLWHAADGTGMQVHQPQLWLVCHTCCKRTVPPPRPPCLLAGFAVSACVYVCVTRCSFMWWCACVSMCRCVCVCVGVRLQMCG